MKKECLGKEKSVTFLWQGATLAEEHRTTGTETVIHRWHFEPGTFVPIAKEVVEQGASSIYPIVTDHLGTPKELFDAEGECVWQADHALWGKASVLGQRWKVVNGEETIYGEVDCELRFQNQWEDEESGLYYNLNRYYDPESGQYLSQDPIRLEGGLRTHGYVHDPMQWVDPLGLAGCGKANKWVDDSGNIIWPPNRGFAGKPKTKILRPGTRVDRYGYEGGTFVSPEGTPYTNRALAPGTENKPYNIYEVVKPVKVKSGKVEPWFDEAGGGTQHEFDRPISELITEGILRRV